MAGKGLLTEHFCNFFVIISAVTQQPEDPNGHVNAHLISELIISTKPDYK